MREIENRTRNRGVSLQKNVICNLEQARVFVPLQIHRLFVLT